MKIRFRSIYRHQKQIGATAVEFAWVASVFLMLVIGILEWGRILMQISAVGEESQRLARLASLCDVGAIHADSELEQFLPGLPLGLLTVNYLPEGCDASSCQWVSVSTHAGMTLESVNPFLAQTLSWPAITTSVPRESMAQSGSDLSRSVCSF